VQAAGAAAAERASGGGCNHIYTLLPRALPNQYGTSREKRKELPVHSSPRLME